MSSTRRNFLNRTACILTGSGLLSAGANLPIWNVPLLAPNNNGRTEESVKAIRRGMKWLERAKCPGGGYGSDVGQKDDIGCSAVVGLSMLAEGSTPHVGPHRHTLRKLNDYLIKKTEEMSELNITSATGTQLQNKIGQQAHTFFALLFLSQIAGETRLIKKTFKACGKLTNAVVKTQKGDGSWGGRSWAPVLGTVMGWTSLRSSHFAGFDVGGSPEKTAECLIRTMTKNLNQQQHWMHQLYKHAAGIRVLYAMGKENEPVVKAAFEKVLSLVTNGKTAFNQAGGEEYLAFHLITETMLQKEDQDWDKWFPVVRDKIIEVQNSDGSWTGHHCITSRTFCTAAACLVLSAPNRYLPISQK